MEQTEIFLNLHLAEIEKPSNKKKPALYYWHQEKPPVDNIKEARKLIRQAIKDGDDKIHKTGNHPCIIKKFIKSFKTQQISI